MPPKRKSDGKDGGTTAKKAKTTSTAAPKLKKSKRVEWESNWLKEKPTGEWARKSVDRWHLLAPYDTNISEALWKNYYKERAALNDVNTLNSAVSKTIVSEELCQNTFSLLMQASKNVAQVIYGAVTDDEEERVAIARTLNGSLYYTQLWGNDEEGDEGDPNPRTDYHYRQRMRMSEKFADLLAKGRYIDECNPKEPSKSAAITKDRQGRQKPAEGTAKAIKMDGSKMSGTTGPNLSDLENYLFGGSGWLSPLKIFQLTAHAGTVGIYGEAFGKQLLKKCGLDKFKLFQGETDGKTLATKDADAEKWKALLKEVRDKDSKELVCVPQRLLEASKGVVEASSEDEE